MQYSTHWKLQYFTLWNIFEAYSGIRRALHLDKLVLSIRSRAYGTYRGWVCRVHSCWWSRWTLSGSWQLSWPRTTGSMGWGYSLRTSKLHGSLKASAAHSELPPPSPHPTGSKSHHPDNKPRKSNTRQWPHCSLHLILSYLHLWQTNFPLSFDWETQKLVYPDNWHIILTNFLTYKKNMHFARSWNKLKRNIQSTEDEK